MTAVIPSRVTIMELLVVTMTMIESFLILMKIKTDLVPKVLRMMKMMTIMKMMRKLKLNAAFLIIIREGKTSMSPSLFCVVNTNLDTWFLTLALHVLQA